MFDDLYNMDILTLAGSLKNTALDTPDASVRKVSKLCGSWLEIDVNLADARVSEVALRVQACALGQSSAAILNDAIFGASLAELQAARDGLRAMLKDGGPPPNGRFARLAVLAGVRDYPPRHVSTLLAFDAAVDAVSLAQKSRAQNA